MAGLGWSTEDVNAAVDDVRERTNAVHELMLKAARVVLQFGSKDEVG